MHPVYILAFLLLLAVVPASAQHSITFPDTRCDSVVCRSIELPNSSGAPEQVVSIRMKDSLYFSVDPEQTFPIPIPVSGSYTLRVCFHPLHRGIEVDSIEVLVRSQSGRIDTLHVRLRGKGIGPRLTAEPTVIQFPKTNIGGSASMTVMLYNKGETTLRLTPASFSVITPFRLVTPLPVNIPTEDSLEIEIAFEPTVTGVYPILLDILAGCSSQAQVSLNGITDFSGIGAVLQITKLGFNPVNQEQATCETVPCNEMTLTNAGNAPLTIEKIEWQQGTSGYSITPQPTLPLVIEPNSQQVFTVCLQSSRRGLLSDTLLVTSNTRNSIAFGVVIDQSNSMREQMDCEGAPQRIAQARIQAQQFVGRTLLHLPAAGVQDYLAIIRYGSEVTPLFPMTPITEASRLDAQARIGTLTATGGGTYTGKALKQMFDTLALQPLSKRIVVLLTDGTPEEKDTLDDPVASIVDAARANGITIFTIGIDVPRAGEDYLETIATQTGGLHFDGTDCDLLQNAFAAITEIVSRGTLSTEPFAMRVTAPLLVNSGNIDYDTIRLGGVACRTLTLTNVGEGDAIVERADIIDSTGAPHSVFYVDPATTFPIEIPANGQVTIQVCFRPTSVRPRGGRIQFSYNNCTGTDSLQAELYGNSRSDVNLRLNDRRVGVPGEKVTLPIYSDSALAHFNIRNATLTLRWNRTMLLLGELRAGRGAPGARVELASPVFYQGRYALASIKITGETIVGGGEIALADFTIMRGDTLATDVELVAGQFEDDNPSLTLVNVASVELDSSCFRDSRPVILQGAPARIVAGEFTPSPSQSGNVAITLESTEATMLTIEIYSSDGQRRSMMTARPVEQGSNRISLDLNGMGAGVYHALFRTAAGETFMRTLVFTQ